MASFVDYPSPMGRINMDYISKYKAEEIDGVFGITLIGGNGSNMFSIWENNATNATITVSNYTFTAVTGGIAGNDLDVTIAVSGNDTVQSVDLTGDVITFISATDGGGVATSTEADVKIAFDADESISALIDTVIAGDGTPIASASGPSSLAGATADTSEADRDTFIDLVDTEFLLTT